MVFHKGERLDVVRMLRLDVFPGAHDMAHTNQAKKVVHIVEAEFVSCAPTTEGVGSC